MSEPSAREAAATQLVDKQMRIAGHVPAAWAWDEEAGMWVAMCPVCHCYSYVRLDGAYYGATLLVHCSTLAALYRMRLPVAAAVQDGST